MALAQEIVVLQAPATNITQDFTVAGFGTPTCCVVIASRGAQAAFGAHGTLSVGMYDGTNQNVNQAGVEDNNAVTANQAKSITLGGNVVTIRFDGTERRQAVASMITDGVRLTWAGTTPGSHRPYVTVWMFKGTTSVLAGFNDPDVTVDISKNITTTGVNPKLILMSSTRNTIINNAVANASMSFGFAFDNGAAIEQMCAAWACLQGDPTDTSYQISNNRAGATVNAGGVHTPGLDITAMGTGQYTVTTRTGSGTNCSFVYLAMDLVEDVHTFSAAVPIAAGDWDPSNSAFTPQCLCMIGGVSTVLNQAENGGNSESLAVYVATDSGDESGHTICVQDGDAGVTLMTSESQEAAQFEIATSNVGVIAEDFKASSPTFDATGVVFADANVNESGSARQVVGFMIAAPPVDNPMMMRSMQVRHNG